jgi:CheY-like chemotaxis protein
MTTPLPNKLKRWFPTAEGLYKAVGCKECGNTGYRGRLAIMEIMVTDPEIERRIGAADSTERIAEAARRGGMRTMWESGAEHVIGGETDIEELLRVLEVPGENEEKPVQRGTTQSSSASSVRSPTPPPMPAVRQSVRNFLPEDVLELVDDVAGGAKKAGRQTVLLVEDEDALRQVLRDLLEREGYSVIEAQDGVQALDEIDRHAPDALVLDLNLPRLDGYQVLSHLRARPGTAELPVLVLTAKGDEESEVRVFENGANDFITKPFRPRALSARLKALLRKT